MPTPSLAMNATALYIIKRIKPEESTLLATLRKKGKWKLNSKFQIPFMLAPCIPYYRLKILLCTCCTLLTKLNANALAFFGLDMFTMRTCLFVWFYVAIPGYIRLKYINGRQSSIESLTKLTLSMDTLEGLPLLRIEKNLSDFSSTS